MKPIPLMPEGRIETRWLRNPNITSATKHMHESNHQHDHQTSRPTQNATVLQVPDTTAGAQSVHARFRARNGAEAKAFWVFGRVFKQRILAARDAETHTDIGDDSSSFQAFSGPVEAAVKVFVVVQAEQSFVHAW
jgi:hypothetical protein